MGNCLSMGSNGGSRARGGANYSAASIASKLTTPKSIKDRGGLPELSGSSSEISEATKIRKGTGRYLLNYAVTKGTASPEITSKYINGTPEERARFVLQRAEEMTFGNSSLLPDKIKSEIAAQKEYADRYNRFAEVITHHKSASWWTGQGNTIVATVAMKDYIDGKGWNEAILGKKR